MYACSLYCKTININVHEDGKKRVRKTILSAKYPDLFCLENCHSTSNYESLSNRKMLNTIINMMDDFYHKQ